MLELGVGRALEVRVAGRDETFAVPLSKWMPVPWARRLMALGQEPAQQDVVDFYFDYIGSYLGDAMDLLTLQDVRDIMSAISEDVGPGESQASPEP